MKEGVWCCLLFYLHGEQWWQTGGPQSWWRRLYTQPHKVQLWRHRPQHPTKFRSPSAANAAEPEEIGKGQLCNFFLAAWRGKCASACFIKPPVWAIVRKATAGTDKREPRADLSIHLRTSDALFIRQNYRDSLSWSSDVCNPSMLNKR